jgi:hypothetical protein
MRRLSLGRALWLALAAVGGVGCDTDQPLQGDAQDVEVRFLASGATVNRYDVWTFWEDSDDDGERDDLDGDGAADTFMWCQFDGLGGALSVPWTYSLQVKILRAGAVEPELVTSAAALSNGANRAAYDDFANSVGGNDEDNPALSATVIVTHQRGECSLDTDIRCNPLNPQSTFCADFDAGTCRELRACSGDVATSCVPGGADSCVAQGKGTCSTIVMVERRFDFENGVLSTNPEGKRLMTGAHPDVIAAKLNPLFDADPDRAFLIDPASSGQSDQIDPGGGRCPGVFVGPEQIDGAPAPLAVPLGNGDTLIVQAKRFDNQPDGLIFGQTANLAAQVFVGGVALAASDVQGNLTGTASAGAVVDFYFAVK